MPVVQASIASVTSVSASADEPLGAYGSMSGILSLLAVCAEAQRGVFNASALHIEHMVYDDAVKPGTHAATTLKRCKPRHYLNENLLSGVLGVLGMKKHADSNIVDPALMAFD